MTDTAPLDQSSGQPPLDFSISAHDIAMRPHRQTRIVLVVEDDVTTVMLLRALAGPGIRVVTASTAAEAVREYRQHVPDLVFLDIGLPDADGLALLGHITAADPGAQVVMLTANAYRENLDKARAAGARGFVAKPFTRGKIQQTLAALIRIK